MAVACTGAPDHRMGERDAGKLSDGDAMDASFDWANECSGTTLLFQDITDTLDLPDEPFMDCALVQDLDLDGANDIVLLTPLTAEILWNIGDGTFQRQSYPIPTDSQRLIGCAAADLEGNGLRDLIVTDGLSPILLTHEPARTFTNASERLGATGSPPSRALGVFDVDADGWLDLYVGKDSPLPAVGPECAKVDNDFQCHLLKKQPKPAPNLLLRQRADGTFEDASIAFGLQDPGLTLALSASDLNGDRQPDLLVGNDFGRNGLYLSSDDGVYVESSAALGLLPYNHAMGIAFADFDLDSQRDLYITDLGPDQLYFGSETGFAQAPVSAGIIEATRNHVGWGVVAQDFDNDGDEDIAVGNSYVAKPGELVAMVEGGMNPTSLEAHAADVQSDFLFENCGDRTFLLSEVPISADAIEPSIGMAPLAGGDLDGDGGIDLVGVHPAQHARVLRNVTAERGHWLTLRIVGAAPNRDAIGAIVEITAGKRKQLREVHVMGAAGHGATEVHIGLGPFTTADVTVYWPGGGDTTVTDVSADASLSILQD